MSLRHRLLNIKERIFHELIGLYFVYCCYPRPCTPRERHVCSTFPPFPNTLRRQRWSHGSWSPFLLSFLPDFNLTTNNWHHFPPAAETKSSPQQHLFVLALPQQAEWNKVCNVLSRRQSAKYQSHKHIPTPIRTPQHQSHYQPITHHVEN